MFHKFRLMKTKLYFMIAQTKKKAQSTTATIPLSILDDGKTNKTTFPSISRPKKFHHKNLLFLLSYYSQITNNMDGIQTYSSLTPQTKKRRGVVDRFYWSTFFASRFSIAFSWVFRHFNGFAIVGSLVLIAPCSGFFCFGAGPSVLITGGDDMNRDCSRRRYDVDDRA